MKSLIKPASLQKGDTVAIVCTARKFSLEEVVESKQLLESWGLRVVLGSTIGKDSYQLGGTDEERAADFNAQLRNKEVKAIWCARGGYGTVRVIDKIDFRPLIAQPKWVIGFSDVTVLHSHIHNLGIQTIHGIMAFSVAKALPESIASFKSALFGEAIEYTIPGNTANKKGYGKGVLVGGNLSILYSLCGSASSIATKGKILFIEDLDEYLYHVDRMMYNLKRNGMLSGLSGLVVGGMTDMHDNTIPFGFDARQIILDVTKEYDYPIIFDFPAGHGVCNVALYLGEEVELNVGEDEVSLSYSLWQNTINLESKEN